MSRYLPLILLGVLLNACAQLVLKQGMRNIGHFAFSIQNILPIGVKVALNPFVMIGILCYVVSVIVWLMVLSRVDVSYAYPLLSVGYIVTALQEAFFRRSPRACTLGRHTDNLPGCISYYKEK